MAGMSPSAQALGLPGQGDLTADQLALQKKKQAAMSPLDKMIQSASGLLSTYGQAAHDLLSVPGQAVNSVKDIQDAANADPEAIKRRRQGQ